MLVTHHVDLVLPGAYYLVRMLDGRIDVMGTIKDLRTNGHLAEVVHDAEADAEATKTEPKTPTVEEAADVITEAPADKDKKKPRQLIKEEARAEGSVKWGIYKTYITASSYIVWVLVIMLILTGQLLFVAERLWIKVWGEVRLTSMSLGLTDFLRLTAKWRKLCERTPTRRCPLMWRTSPATQSTPTTPQRSPMVLPRSSRHLTSTPCFT